MAQNTPEQIDPSAVWHPLRVARIIDETHDSRSVVLEIPESLRETFRYRAGQFLSFRIEVNGERLIRCYSLASSPDTESEHKVTVKRVAGGRASNWFHDALAQGDLLEVMRPAGVFCLSERGSNIVLFGGGSGITPVISIIKTALATTGRALKLVYANRDERSIIFKDELDALWAAHPNRLEIVHRLDDQHGFVDDATVREYVGDDTDADFYICGPGPFMDTVESTLIALGAPSSQICIERFEYASESGERETDIPMASSDDTPTEISVTLDGETKSVPYQAGDTVLQTVRKGGMDPPFACEEGYCGCCMATARAGTFEMLHNDCLSPKEVAEGKILTCQSIPKSGEAAVEYPD